MMLSTAACAFSGPAPVHAMRAMPLMNAAEGAVETKVNADTVTGMVVPTADFGSVRSWYDSGVRLDGSTPAAFPAPAAAPAPAEVASPAAAPAAPAPEPVAEKALRSDLGF